MLPTFDEFLEQLEKSSRELAKRNEEAHKKWAEENPEQAKCNHGITFDKNIADQLVGSYQESWSEGMANMGSQEERDLAFIRGPGYTEEIRKRWPRLCGQCPLGCGYNGIYYASIDHYIMGDW